MKLSPAEVLLALMVPLLWGMGLVFAKGAIEHFPPILLMSLRFALTASVMVWFVARPVGNHRKLFLIAIVAASIQYSFTYTGLKDLTAGVAALVVQLEVPFLVLLGAIMLGERPGLLKWIGIAMAFCGVALIAGEIEVGGEWLAVAFVILGAFFWAVGQVFIRQLKDISGSTVTAWVAMYAAPQLLVMSLVFEDGHVDAIREAGWIVWLAVIYLGLIMTAVGYWIWNFLIRKHEVGAVAPFLLLLPVFSVIGGVVFLGETLQGSELIGGVVIISGVALITLRFGRRGGE